MKNESEKKEYLFAGEKTPAKAKNIFTTVQKYLNIKA
jgi:hypothetical protein